MTVRIEYSPLIQVPESKYKNFLIYGKSGVGKTTSIATMHDHVLVLNQEKRLGSLKAQFKAGSDDLNRFTVLNTYEYDNPYVGYMTVYNMLLNDPALPTWIVIDSLTTVAKAILKGKISGTSNGGKKVHGLQAYGECANEVTEIYESFCTLSTNFVAICHLARHTDQEGASTLAPSLPGNKLPEDIAYPFDCVYFLDRTYADKQGKSQRYFQVEPDARATAKNCIDIGPRIEPVDFSIIHSKIMEGS